ncbi:hypothetical protein C2S51_029454 [Perilla frutescens var. frutescens]|nr:hypothetical protein C2S51_029454 [Perilla frutescens var. frutescens]
MVGIGGVMNGIWDGVVPPECQPNPLILRLNEALGLKWEEAREPLHRLLPNDNDTFTGIGPGMPFANALLKRDPAIGTIGLVPCARSGSSISSWARDTPNYSKMLRLARAAVNQGGILRAFLWYQGESDTNELADAEAYSRRLVELFNNVRADLQSPSLQMIQVALASGSKYKERIREIQLNTELPNVKCVDAGGLPLIKVPRPATTLQRGMAEKNEAKIEKKEIERRKRIPRQEIEESEDEDKIAHERRTKSRHDKQVVVEQTQAQTQTGDDDTSSNEESDGDIVKKLPSLKMRTCPKSLYQAIKKLNTEQKKAVEELGFGSILHLDVRIIPKKLSYWLVDNVDPQSKEIKLNNGRRLRFDAEDVSLILGFPRGPQKLAKMRRSEPSSMVDKFRNKLGKDYNRISVSYVRDEMLKERDGGEWFRRLFMVLLTCCMIENSGNGYVFCQLLHYFDEVNMVREYDWCDYVVRSLVDAAIQWQQRKDRFFTGPIFFLLVSI